LRLCRRHPSRHSIGGFGSFFRLLRKSAEVFVEAPAKYGARIFKCWTSSTGASQPSPWFAFRLDRPTTLIAQYN
jgi:hypothetical protein